MHYSRDKQKNFRQVRGDFKILLCNVVNYIGHIFKGNINFIHKSTNDINILKYGKLLINPCRIVIFPIININH